MSTAIDCAWLLAEPGTRPAQARMRIAIGADGRIASVAPSGANAGGPRRLVLPALANAHDHGRTFRNSTLGACGHPLESWLFFQGLAPGVDPYLCAATSFSRSLRQGVANLMVHYTRVQGVVPYVEEARAVARAAHDVGVRIGFAIAMRDRHGMGYGPDESVLPSLRPEIRDEVARRLSVKPVAPAQQVALVDEVAEAIEADGHADHATVQYGPTAVHWCSTPLLEAIARACADSGRPVHMHLLETPYQRAWADQNHPGGIVKFLDDIGLLTPRLTLAHCVHARPEELALIAERGATIAVNTSSNLGLRSGIAPLAEMLRQGCRVAMGLDGGALDEDDDALREMRLAWSLHRGWGFEQRMSVDQLWGFASRNGPRSVRGATRVDPLAGSIVPGAPADLLVLDWDDIDDEHLFDEVDPLQQFLARATGRHIAKVIVGGRSVVQGGRVLGVDEPALVAELLARTRTALAANPAHADWRAAVRAMAEDLGPLYLRSAFAGCA
ncbi:amidohydrolase family protein [Variovorax sp. OV329]|uniref:amidohydrolase family protein n=1 Tax=Variovorax sp. OV329 TaxID=1882825 RepID=UPI0008F34B7E|nr:amidohydrolase family protein [Variovorax sp. OV329]SFN31588.1 Cytosine/adenosine deaminase [Variovorax sp. OV329]